MSEKPNNQQLATRPREQSRRGASTAPWKTVNGKRLKTKKRNVKTKPQRQIARAMPMPKVSECGLHYASALADPVNTPVGACIPYGYPIPSQKIKTFTRGTFQVGTLGVGFILVRPPLAKDVSGGSLSFTTSASVFAITDTFSTATVAIAVVDKLPFTSAQMTSTATPVAGRMVASELRIRYAGTEANRNGIVTSLEEPDHRDLNVLTANTFVAYTPSLNERPPPDGEWHSVKWSGPVTAAEIDFQAFASFRANYSMGFVVRGLPSDLYEWEYHLHNEYAGTPVNGMTPSHIDATAYGKVVETYKAITSNGPLNNDTAPSAFSNFVRSAGSTISNLVTQYGIPMLAGMISPALIAPTRVGMKLLTSK